MVLQSDFLGKADFLAVLISLKFAKYLSFAKGFFDMVSTVVLSILAIITLFHFNTATKQHKAWKSRFKYREPDYIYAKEAAQSSSRSAKVWFGMTIMAFIVSHFL